jgi:hypothetical protein
MRESDMDTVDLIVVIHLNMILDVLSQKMYMNEIAQRTNMSQSFVSAEHAILE